MKPRLSQRIQFSLAYALVVVVLLSLLQSWLLAPRTIEIPMSKFLDLLRTDKIERVALTEKEIREGLEGNLCRCTGYHNIVKAIAAAHPLMHAKAAE